MIELQKEFERVLDCESDLLELLAELPETQIAIALTDRPFPVIVHVIRHGDRATIREMDYVLTVE